jgi:hypothetical protein
VAARGLGGRRWIPIVVIIAAVAAATAVWLLFF